MQEIGKWGCSGKSLDEILKSVAEPVDAADAAMVAPIKVCHAFHAPFQLLAVGHRRRTVQFKEKAHGTLAFFAFRVKCA